MNCVDEFFLSVPGIQYDIDMERKYGLERNAFSQLDHDLKYDFDIEEILLILKCDCCKHRIVPQRYKVYIAALTEYIYNSQNVQPPEWVFESQYYLDEVTFSLGAKILCEDIGSDFLQTFVDSAIPEFKKRNYMITDVLSAV